MNFHLEEVSVHNLGIGYGAFGIALVPVEDFFFHAEKSALVAMERFWSNTLKMIKTVELLPLLFLCVCMCLCDGSYFEEKLLYVSVNSSEIHGF